MARPAISNVGDRHSGTALNRRKGFALSVSGAGTGDIDDLQQRVKEGVSRLRGLDVDDTFSAEILAQLLEGRKTVAEIVEQTYGLTSTDEGYKSSYGKVWRELRQLESKGLVSRRLFGRDKPYRLTQLAVVNLAKIGGKEQQLPLIHRTDIAVYLVTVALSLPNAMQTLGWIQLGELTTMSLFGSLCFFLGFSCSRVIQTARRVF